MKSIFTVLLMLFSAVLVKAENQYLLDSRLVGVLKKDTFDRLSDKFKVPKAFRSFRYDVAVYEITYKGKWIDGTDLKAKGICYVPVGASNMPEAVYCHGTQVEQEVKIGLKNGQMVTSAILASDGYFSMYPYYYGIGGGEKVHLYIHAETEASSVAYMILAGRELQQSLKQTNNGQVFISGYSQGGHAAMAAHQYLEQHPELGIRVAASSPMSGPYDLTGVQSEVMSQPYDRPHYLPYLLVSYQYAYQIIPGDVTEVFKPEYQCVVDDFFKIPRCSSHGKLDGKLPRVPEHMIEPFFLNAYRNDTAFAFTNFLKQNSNWKWKPQAPMQLCACYGDNEVNYRNSEKAYQYMKGEGSPVVLRLFGKHLNHQGCAPFAFMYTKIFFDRVRDGKKKVNQVPVNKRFLLKVGAAIAGKKAKKKAKEKAEKSK